MGPGEADHRIKRGIWQRIAGSGFVLSGQLIDPVMQAWALTLTWPGAVLWGPSALRLWVPRVPLPASLPIYGAVHTTRRPSTGLVAKRTDLDAVEVVERAGLRIQAPNAALVDSMMLLTEPEGGGLFSWAFTRDQADPAQVIDAIRRRRGRRGARAMARYMAMAEIGVVSAGELLLALLLEQHGITGWQPNVRLKLPGQPPYRLDFLFAREKLVVEVDGWEFHSSRQAFEDNRWRDAHLQAAGYRVLRLTWHQLTNQPETTIALVRAALGR